MKKMKWLVYVLIILMVLLSCEFAGISVDFGSGGQEVEEQAAPVEAGIDAPANNSSLEMASVDISYHASSQEGVAAVELSINGEVVSSIATPGSDQKVVALRYTWQPTVSGSHTIRVRAQSASGVWSDYAVANVNIAGDQKVPDTQAEQESQAEAVEGEAEEEAKAEPEPTETPEGVTFFDIKHDKDLFYYGDGSCGSREITISTRVTNPDDIYVLIMFTRFADKESGGITKWDAGHAMSKKSDDLYSITLQSNKIANYTTFDHAVMHYQFIAQGDAETIVARGEVQKDISMQACK